MVNENNKDHRIEEILDSLEGIQRAEPSPFFYTRLHARLSRVEKNVWEKVTYFLSRPVIAFTMVSVVVLVNLTVLMNQSSPSATANSEQAYMSVYDDYTLASNDFYDYEIKEP